ncbi:hypothetical protein [Streptomyces sp. TRM75561]|uniref:hypothetical protein n=1 Tax=Streptomyces sp. TRM75561 TaxID=2975269 RepID=UPI00244C8BB1|nr:hypothetical protein [Streptomyces sp. TRM75561]MDH3039189.1 hypothetical protein [Streptomyces sp. TRM75561]
MAFTEKPNKTAYTTGGLASAGPLDDIIALTLLRDAVEAVCPWQAARNERIVMNALAAGPARPLHLEGFS